MHGLEYLPPIMAKIDATSMNDMSYVVNNYKAEKSISIFVRNS